MRPTTSTRGKYHWRERGPEGLFASDPAVRLAAAGATQGRARRQALDRAGRAWAPWSAGSANAWVVFLGTRAPEWEDPLFAWSDDPPTLGEPHRGLFYPDRLGYWAEIRRWVSVLVGQVWSEATVNESLSACAILHAHDLDLTGAAIAALRPRVAVALDDGAVERLPATDPADRHEHTIGDPHRPKQAYRGWWARSADGVIAGKAPQHPAAHNFYRAADIDGFLRSAPFST